MHEQVFLLDEHRGQGRYPAYTPNDSTLTKWSRRSDVTYLQGKCFIQFSCPM